MHLVPYDEQRVEDLLAAWKKKNQYVEVMRDVSWARTLYLLGYPADPFAGGSHPSWMDHTSLWQREGQLTCAVCQPYHLDSAALKSLHAFMCAEVDVRVDGGSWHYPSSTLRVIVYAKKPYPCEVISTDTDTPYPAILPAHTDTFDDPDWPGVSRFCAEMRRQELDMVEDVPVLEGIDRIACEIRTEGASWHLVLNETTHGVPHPFGTRVCAQCSGSILSREPCWCAEEASIVSYLHTACVEDFACGSSDPETRLPSVFDAGEDVKALGRGWAYCPAVDVRYEEANEWYSLCQKHKIPYVKVIVNGRFGSVAVDVDPSIGMYLLPVYREALKQAWARWVREDVVSGTACMDFASETVHLHGVRSEHIAAVADGLVAILCDDANSTDDRNAACKAWDEQGSSL